MFCKKCVLKHFANCTNKTPVSGSLLLRPATLLRKESPAQVFSCEFCNFFFFLRNIFFDRKLPMADPAKIYQLKNISKWSVFIELSIMFHQLLSRTSVYLCMWQFRKLEKKLQDQQRVPKKVKFLSKTCFSNKPFTVYKKIIYFCRCHWQMF